MFSYHSKNQKGFSFYNTSKKVISSKRHHTNFDMNMHYFTDFFKSKNISFSRIFALLNAGLFLYVNFRLSKQGTWLGLEGVSYSVNNHERRDYIPLFASLLGSRRIDDLALETGILATIGHKLEIFYGRPFLLKLFLFTYYLGILNSLYWVDSNYSKRERFHVDNPYKRYVNDTNKQEYRFMSSHGFSMSLLYFYMFKNKALRYGILPLLAVDFYIWGPYYSVGAISGIAAGMIL